MSHDDELPDPARVVLQRRIEWMDTDAAGIYHWTTAFRLAEAAEAALHTALGIADFTFGATPRVAVSASFTRPLRFNDLVDVALAVEAIGRTSVRVPADHHRRRGPGRRREPQGVPHRPVDGAGDPVAAGRPRAPGRRRAAGCWSLRRSAARWPRMGVDTVFGLMGSGNLDRHQRAARRRRALLRRPPRGRRDLHGRRLRARERAPRRVQRPPGAGADERDHRADRGGQEPHAAARARGRHARRGAALELPHRPGRPRRGGRGGRRARARAGHGDGRRRPRGAPRAGRAPRGRADAAARRAGGASAPTARAAADGPALAAAAARPQSAVAALADLLAGARRPAIIAGRGAVLAGAGAGAARARRADRRAAGHQRRGQRAVRRRPVRPRHLRRLRDARWPRGCSARPTWWSPSAPR